MAPSSISCSLPSQTQPETTSGSPVIRQSSVCQQANRKISVVVSYFRTAASNLSTTSGSIVKFNDSGTNPDSSDGVRSYGSFRAGRAERFWLRQYSLPASASSFSSNEFFHSEYWRYCTELSGTTPSPKDAA